MYVTAKAKRVEIIELYFISVNKKCRNQAANTRTKNNDLII